MRKGKSGIWVLLCIFFMAGFGVIWHICNMLSPGRVLTIYCWDSTFKDILAKYYPAYNPETEMIGDVEVHWVILPNDNSVYQRNLDKALFGNEKFNPHDNVDMFLVEADYVRKYTDNDYVTLDIESLGIAESELSGQFAYTRQLARDGNGHIRGITWQATPGVMIYRRDIARQVLGTDKPEEVQGYVRDWHAFNQTAARMKKAGVSMLAGYLDTYRVFWSGVERSWLNSEGCLVIDENMKKWLAQTSEFTSRGYNHPYRLWSEGWQDQVRLNTFCYFGPSWLMQYVLAQMAKDDEKTGSNTYGKWAACRGPEPFYWGGTWICAARHTDNQELVADIMRTICLNPEVLDRMARQGPEFVNNVQVMQSLAKDEAYGMEFLAGQNPVDIMLNGAAEINVGQVSPYDQGIHEAFQGSARTYFDGRTSREGAWQMFLAAVWHAYPELQSTLFSYEEDSRDGG